MHLAASFCSMLVMEASRRPPGLPIVPSEPAPLPLPSPLRDASAGTRRSTCSRVAIVPAATSPPHCAGTRLSAAMTAPAAGSRTRTASADRADRSPDGPFLPARPTKPRTAIFSRPRAHRSPGTRGRWNQFRQRHRKRRGLLPRLASDIPHERCPPLPRGHLLIPSYDLAFRNSLHEPALFISIVPFEDCREYIF
jgi:hypothetical protein